MTKSIIINKHGGPEVLEFVDTAVRSPDSKHIKIKNLAIGLNFIDTYHRSGLYPIKLPCGLGMEGAGVVEEVGSAVKNFRKGDNVVYASPPLGSYSDERIIPERIAIKIPDGINHKIVILVTLILGVFTQIFTGITSLIAIIPFFGPFILKIISIPIFYFLNALGWVVSAIAIKKGFVNELSRSRTVTLALLVGIILGYILGNIIPLDK